MEFTTVFFVFICGISESVLPDNVPKQKGAATILLLPIYKVLVVILPARMMYRTPAAQPLTSLLFVLQHALHPIQQKVGLFPDLQEDAKHSCGNFLLSFQTTKSFYPELLTYYKTSYLHHWLYLPRCIAFPTMAIEPSGYSKYTSLVFKSNLAIGCLHIRFFSNSIFTANRALRTTTPSFILFADISILLSKKKGASAEPPPITGPASICNLIAIGITPTCVRKRSKPSDLCRL